MTTVQIHMSCRIGKRRRREGEYVGPSLLPDGPGGKAPCPRPGRRELQSETRRIWHSLEGAQVSRAGPGERRPSPAVARRERTRITASIGRPPDTNPILVVAGLRVRGNGPVRGVSIPSRPPSDTTTLFRKSLCSRPLPTSLSAAAFELVEACDRASDAGPETPWYRPLEGRALTLRGLPTTALGRRITSTALRIVPGRSFEMEEIPNLAIDNLRALSVWGIYAPVLP